MTAPLDRLTAALADRYRIERVLGSGGMATVYLAYDVRHDRPVAVKVLRPELAAVIGPERFLAEIKTTAHLQHAHILGLIDSGEVNGTVFYVMPFVDGESLRDRLNREKQLPIPDAVRIATDVAGALDYAHRRGVIHRDIKPENILLHEGQPLIADFGIALALTRPTDAGRITESGMSLGTPHYMSPEQAMGERTLDARTDVYALGCVLYEMLTGEPPFNGPTAQAIILKVMTVEPEPVTTLRRSVPENVAAATMTALHKVPADRFTTAAEFAAALNNPQYVAPEVAAQRLARGKPRVTSRNAAAIAAIVLLAIAALAGWLRRPGPGSDLSTRFEIPVPDSAFSTQFALSRDGKRILWANGSGFWERALDSLTIRRVRDAVSPPGALRDVSPSGNDVIVSGFGGLSVVPLSGGPARPLQTSGGRGGSWGQDGYVYSSFGIPQSPVRGIVRTRADGTGLADTVATFGAQDSTAVISEIVALPGGHGLVVVLNRRGADSIVAYDLKARAWKSLTPGGIASGPEVAFVEPGYLVYARGASIMVAPLNANTLSLSQPPLPFIDVPSGGISALAANATTLVYLPVPELTGSGVVVRSRSGTSNELLNIPGNVRFNGFTVSPDGKRFAAIGNPQPAAGEQQGAPGSPMPNVYVYQFPSGPMTRLQSNERVQSVAWIPPSGRELSFVRISSDTPTTATLMRRPWDNSAEPAPLPLSRPAGFGGGIGPGGGRGGTLGPISWLPDGRRAVVRIARPRDAPPTPAERGGAPGRGNGRGGRGAAGSGRGLPGGGRGGPPGDLMLFSLDAPAKLDTVVATEFNETNPAVSPNGRLLAFTSDATGHSEVYIRPLTGGAQRQVSLNGGAQPKWARSGKELFYVNADTLFAAEVRPGAEFEGGDVRPLFSARNLNGGYSVLPGDTAFVTLPVPSTNLLVVVTNFAQELNRLFAKK